MEQVSPLPCHSQQTENYRGHQGGTTIANLMLPTCEPSGNKVTVSLFSVLAVVALALFIHCVPFPIHLPGWWHWVPGVVTVRSGIIIDREAFSPPFLELLLLAEDVGLLNGTAHLLVTILDDNDNWPIFSSAAYTVHLLENSPPGNKGQAPGFTPAPPGADG